MDFDYKKYSLEKLQEWVHDAMSSDASPHEIYSTIREVVRENYYYHKEHTSRAYGLLELLNGHRPVADKELFEAVVAEREYYEGEQDNGMRPWGHSDLEYQIANQDKILSCNKNNSSQKSWTNFWEDSPYPLYVSEDGDVWIPDSVTKEDKVVKWQLPIEIDGASGEYYIQFPDDLMQAANIKENDMVEWIPQDNGSYLLKKVNG